MLREILLLIISTSPFGHAISCKNQRNTDVSWFVAYKMPKMPGSLPGSSEGFGFYYLDAEDKSFHMSQSPINNSDQAISYTLEQYYSSQHNLDTMHVFYNDEPPLAELTPVAAIPNLEWEMEFGHTKGVVLFDAQSGLGVWLIHSVPKFPLKYSYEYPASGTEYGQTFLCLTLEAKQLASIGTALYYNYPNIYSVNLPKWATKIAPDLYKACAEEHQTSSVDTILTRTLTTYGPNSISFDLFAKTALFRKDLWASAVALSYNSSLVVESWRRGDLIPTDCESAFPVFDAQSIQVVNNTAFHYTKDHSKYARSLKESDARVCIGDINRMTSQYVRGGGTVCMQDRKLWNAFAVFKEYPHCASPSSFSISVSNSYKHWLLKHNKVSPE